MCNIVCIVFGYEIVTTLLYLHQLSMITLNFNIFFAIYGYVHTHITEIYQTLLSICGNLQQVLTSVDICKQFWNSPRVYVKMYRYLCIGYEYFKGFYSIRKNIHTYSKELKKKSLRFYKKMPTTISFNNRKRWTSYFN